MLGDNISRDWEKCTSLLFGVGGAAYGHLAATAVGCVTAGLNRSTCCKTILLYTRASNKQALLIEPNSD